MNNPLVFKQRLWMREPDAKLFSYLLRLPKLEAFIVDFKSISRQKATSNRQWVIGQGYQPFNDDAEGDSVVPKEREKRSDFVGRLPDVPIGAFTRLAQAIDALKPAESSHVRRYGFEAGFQGVRILVPRGVETAQNRLRATYCDQSLTFQHIMQAIVVPDGDEERAKLLTALLNSRIAVWYAFHGTASFGSDRPEVGQANLLILPFPSPADLPNETAALSAAKELVQIVDEARAETQNAFAPRVEDQEVLQRIDQLAYKYFCLSPDEIALIDDTVDFIMPAVQPHEGHFPDLWQVPDAAQRALYAHTLSVSLSGWFQGQNRLGTRLMARSADLAILRLRLNGHEDYAEEQQGDLTTVLEYLSEHIHQPLDGNFQLMPDLRVFVGGCLYLIKPMQLRFWLRSTALADADGIALDLQQAVTMQRPRSAS